MPARPAAPVTAGQRAPQFLALASGAIDEGVDGFEPQGAQAALMAGLEPAGDLLRGPSFGEAITDEVPQPAIPFEDGFTPSAPLRGSGGGEGRIAATGQGVSAQLPRHGGLGPPHRLGDGADRTASRLQRSDVISFFIQQMRIAWHGNIPKVLINQADSKSAGGVALRVRTQECRWSSPFQH